MATHENQVKKALEKEIKETQSKKNLYHGRILDAEKHIDGLGHEKVSIQQDIIEHEQIREKMNKDLAFARNKKLDLRKNLSHLMDHVIPFNEIIGNN